MGHCPLYDVTQGQFLLSFSVLCVSVRAYTLAVEHGIFMHRCLELASKARGHVGNGALVGAVLARQGKMVAETYHKEYGGQHAERLLLDQVKNIQPDDTLYVNLEPCCHEGKTPPCTDAIIERGVRKLVFGMVDPDPRMGGEGIRRLQKAGVEVIGPVLRAETERLNRGFVMLRTKHRPWVTLKTAQTRDGKMCNADGSRLRITNAEQDAWSHRFLRARHDAILVGVGTVLADDPSLTVREPGSTWQPFRIILDPQMRLPSDAALLTDEHRARTILVTKKSVQGDSRKKGLQEIIHCEIPYDGENFEWRGLWECLTSPHDDFAGISSVLVEGGPGTWERFRRAGIVDEEVVLVGD
jgi:diaminohydroxyphosphoribosylaminopyrimidine deaminase/5-amino-6-(5-phosphoribosylamino)uracil reductase